ncbi:GLEYA domain-containing protein [Mariannaea sp. PMI_226]|nr:GLEYA domain-containing protein [Mariannaea sp. PMI_226]
MRLTSTFLFIGLCGQAVFAGPCRPRTTTTSLSTPTTTTASSQIHTDTTSSATGTTTDVSTGPDETTTPTTAPSSQTTPPGSGTTTPGQGSTTTSGGQTETTTPVSSGTTSGPNTYTTPGSSTTGSEPNTTTTPGSGTTTIPGSDTTTTPNSDTTTTPGSSTTAPGQDTTTTPGQDTTTTPSQDTTTTPGGQTTSESTTPAPTTTTGPSTTTPASTPTTTGSFCSVYAPVIDVLKDTPEATPFCDNYLSVTTTRSTLTVTVTPTPVHSLVSLTVTVDAVTTSEFLPPRESLDIETTTETIYEASAITTVLPSVAVLSCLNSAYTAHPITTIIEKRVLQAQNPPFIPADWDASQISQACSCLALQSPATTLTEYKTLTPGVQVDTATQFYTPIVTVTETPVTTVTSYLTDPVTIITTTVATDYAVETTIETSGLKYRKYTHTFNENTAGFTSSYFRTANYDWQGVLASPFFSTPNWPNGGDILSLSDGHTFSAPFTAIIFNGFFVAKETGQYTFSSSSDLIDNWGYLWVGDAAYNWNENNAAFKASRTVSGYFGGTYSVVMNTGDAIPITWLWANGGGPGQSDLTITTPGGLKIQGGSGNFATPCSDQVFWAWANQES